MGRSERAGDEGIRAKFNWKESFHAGLEGEIGFRPRIKIIPGKDSYTGMEEGKQHRCEDQCIGSLAELKPKCGKKRSGWSCPLGGRLQ